MSTEDALGKRGKALEDDYFRRRDQQLIERMRAKAAADRTQQALGAATGLHDSALLQELQTLGFTPDTVALLPLMPLLQVAWAEGGVSAAERELVLELAAARGIAAGSAADAQLMEWLANRPSDAAFAGATRLIHAMLESGGRVVTDLDANELVEYAEKVAAASGGLFGLGKVSAEEKALLTSIATNLKGRPSS